MEKLLKFLKEEEGIESLEWGLMAALFAFGLIIAVTAMEDGVSTFFSKIGNEFGTATVPSIP